MVTSPLYPRPYIAPERGAASLVCNWYITARPGKRLLLNFEHFAVEGHLTGEWLFSEWQAYIIMYVGCVAFVDVLGIISTIFR